MSRSSTDRRGSGDEYFEGWRALHRLVRKGNSFSGGERNTCFLNLGPGRFADASAVSGFDFADDGRALAVTDWDQDGRLDLWVTNRTGPRVRFLHNRLASSNGYVALRLEGRGANGDGIGARVEVHTPSAVRVKTLAAGSGFLAQSSKWLHFGLGRAETVERVVVHWPGGAREELAGVRPNARWLLVEESGVAREVAPREGRVELEETVGTPGEAEPASERTRTVLAARLDLPDVPYRTLEGRTGSIRSFAGAPLLLNLWAVWCRTCLDELGEITERADELRDAGLEVLTLGTDAVEYRFQARHTLERMGFPFESGWTVDETTSLVRAVQMAVLESHGTVVLPTSLLIDAEGRLVALYRGRVDVDRLLADLRLPADARATRAAATPFEGRWTSPPGPPVRFSLAGLLVEHGLDAEASAYLSETRAVNGFDAESGHPLARSQLALGRALLDEGRYTDAEAALRRVLRSTPRNAPAHLWLARSLRAQKRHAEAARHYEALLELTPRDARAHEELGRVRLAQGHAETAALCFRRAIECGGDPRTLVELLEKTVAEITGGGRGGGE